MNWEFDFYLPNTRKTYKKCVLYLRHGTVLVYTGNGYPLGYIWHGEPGATTPLEVWERDKEMLADVVQVRFGCEVVIKKNEKFRTPVGMVRT